MSTVYLVMLLWFGDATGTAVIPQPSMEACQAEVTRQKSLGRFMPISICVNGAK